MKLATRDNGERDGCTVVVSHDLTLMADAADIAPTLQQALELAPRVWPALQARYQALNARRYPAAQPYDPASAGAAAPRGSGWTVRPSSAMASACSGPFICRRLLAPTRRR